MFSDSKIALLGDLHLGAKKDDPWLEQIIYDFCKRFTDYCKEHNIKYCLQAGDWFDVRQGISQRTLQFLREDIAPMFQDAFINTWVDVGNHDMKNKEIITPNSCKEALGHLDKFTVIEEPTTITVSGVEIDMIPWICKSNEKQIADFIAKTKSKYCMGHFELTGFYFYKGLKSNGLEPDFLEKYKHVWSGHFHTISDGGNVQFLGTPYTITLGDANDPRGFWIFDPDSTKTSFVENPVMNHYRVYFDADTWSMTSSEIAEKYTGKTVKMVIENVSSDTNKVNIDRILDDFESVCHEFQHEYTLGSLIKDDESLSDVDVKVEKTIEIINKQVAALDESDSVKDRVNKIFSGLHVEASNL